MPESDVGQFFGKYFLLKKLAAGGMGEIFLAKQQGPAGFEKILVVKKVLAHLTENKEFVELFLGEARLAARMSHRNIVQVFELGEHEGQYYIAMEFVQGKALRDVIDVCIKRKEKLPAELCRNIVEQICDGASYAHNLTDITGRSLNIIHRDLNPQNVLISYTGDVKVIDFGIAKSEMSTVKTEAGMIKGKFVYMSPEQSLAKKLDKRSDIFAIGITLYEMLTGINPFHKNNIVLTLEAIQRYEPPPPSEYDPALAPFDPIIAKVLAKDRDRRYSDAGEMLDDLRRIVVPPSPERLGQFMSRIFRAQLEEEQKILKDTDSARVTGATAVKRTPAKAAPAAPPVEPENATMLLPGTPAKGKGNTPAKAAPAARPAPRAPATPAGARKPAVNQGGDTLMDMEAPKIPGVNAPADDAPGATVMLKPGQNAPPPPPRKKPAVMETIPDGGLLAPQFAQGEGDDEAAAQGSAPKAPERKKEDAPRPPPARPPQRGAARGPVKKKGMGLWIGLGVGGVALLGGVIALALVLLQDDTKPVRKKKVVVPVENATPVPSDPPPAPQAPAPSDEKKPEDTKTAEAAAPVAPPADVKDTKKSKKEEKAEAAAEKAAEKRSSKVEPPTDAKAPEKKPEPAPEKKVAAAPKSLGTLMVNPGPNVPLSFGGAALGKVNGLQRLNVTAESGTLEIGDATTQFKVVLDYARAGKELVFKVRSEPWAIVSVDQVSKGKTPLADVRVEDKMAVLELKKPGQDTGMTFRLRFQGN